MKIVYIGPFRFPLGDAAASRVLNNSRLFGSLGCDVKIISWGGKSRPEDKDSDGKYRYSGFEYIITHEIDIKGNPIKKVLAMLRQGSKTARMLNDEIADIDVIVMYNAGYYITKQVLNLAKKHNVFVVNDITEWYDDNEMPFFMRREYKKNMTRLQHSVKNKIVISEFLHRYYSDSNNCILPPLGYADDIKWQKSASDCESMKDFAGLTFIYAGTPAKKDLLSVAIKAIDEKIKDGINIRFLVIGISKEQYVANYVSENADKSLSDKIIFLGRVPQDDVPAYYKMADFMILLREPNRKNNAGFPTKVMESFMVGVPVITNKTSDLYRYVINGRNGFIIDDYSRESLNKVLNAIIKLSPSKIDDMKKMALSTGQQQFDYRNYKNAVEQFLKKLT